jgi:hypothetical protein
MVIDHRRRIVEDTESSEYKEDEKENPGRRYFKGSAF